jgi:hypothetical protein
MMHSLAWKEYREGWAIWVALALLGTGTVFLTPVFLDLLGQNDPQQQRLSVLISLIVLAVTYGVVTGSMLLAGERESQTLVFLDALTARRSGVWTSKVLIGLAFAAAQGIALTIPFVLAAPQSGGLPARRLFWLLPALTLEATTWGLFSSSFCGSVLSSAGLGGVLHVLSWIVAFVLSAAIRRGESGLLTLRLLLDVLALAGSYLAFCRSDQERFRTRGDSRLRRAVSPAFQLQSPIRDPKGGAGWRSLVWLAWRQGRADLAVLAAATFVLGLAFAPYMLGAWSIWTLLIGVVFGTGVWRNEQAEGSSRFLIDQRLPPGRVWLVKTAFSLGAAILVAACGALGIAVHFTAARWMGPQELARHAGAFGLDIVTVFGNPKVVAVVWLSYGFSAGQLFALLCPKNLVAVMMSLPVSAGLVSPWLPSLISGGLPVWQVFVIPVLLLATGRLVLWAWAGGRLATWQPALMLVACGAVSGLWLIGCLTWRVLEVPDTGEPFDVAAFRASRPSPAQNEAGDRILRAMQALSTHRKEVGPFQASGAASQDPPGRIERRILRLGWKAAPSPREFGGWLDRMFQGKGNWKDELKKGVACPLGMIQDPFQSTRSQLNVAQECREAMTLYRLRAIQLQATGHDREALHALQVLLGLSRHLRSKAVTEYFLMGLTVEEEALRGLEDWARNGDSSPERLRHVLEAVAAHEGDLPPVDEVLKAHYVGAYPGLINYFSNLATPSGWNEPSVADQMHGQLFLLAQQTPWERVRAERLINVLYTEYFAGRQPDPSLLVRQPWLAQIRLDNWTTTRRAADRALCRVRAAQLQLALQLYEREKGQAARALPDLVPRYLRVLPIDPFTGASFGYRVSRGERIPAADWGNVGSLDVVKGQGVLWSAGPDRSDDGGRVQGLPGVSGEADERSDWIYLVPRITGRP